MFTDDTKTDLRLEHALLERALDASDSGILITDAQQPDNPIIWCNPGFSRLTGYDFADVAGKNCRFLQGPETDRETIRKIREAVQSAVSIRVQIYNYTKDGVPFWNDLSISPVRDLNGNLTHFIGVQNIITEQQASSLEQIESARRYAESIVDTSRGPLLILDPDLRVVTANLAFYRGFGVGHGETVGTHLYALGSGQWNIPALRRLLDDVLSNQNPVRDFEVVHDFPHIGRRTMLLNARAVHAKDGLPARILLAIEDITHRQDIVSTSVDFTRGALDALSSHVAILNSEGVIVATNKAWNRFALTNGVGVEGCAGLGVNYLRLCEGASGECADDALAMAQGMRAVLEGSQEDFAHEYPCHAPDERRWFVGRVTRFAYGGQLYLVTAHENITARKLSEESLYNRQKEVESLNTVLHRAMTETHHRVKNNLQVIAALAEIQSDDISNGDHEALRRISHHARALALLHDLLTHQSKSIHANWEVIGTATVLKRLLPLLQPMPGKRQIKTHAEDIPITVREATSLSLLVSELVSNAVKHSPGDIGVKLRGEGDTIQLEVRDSGAGFPEGFDPRRAANTGLELIWSVVHHDLGGSIRFEKVPEEAGGGACVVVNFPLPVLPA